MLETAKNYSHRFEQISIHIEKSATIYVGRVHFSGSQEHVDFGLSIGIHPAQFNHKQFLLEIRSYLNDRKQKILMHLGMSRMP